MGKKLIELKGIRKEYGNMVAIENLNLYINENEFVTLVGPSGCGKTTTLRIIGGFEDTTYGEVILDGVVINNTPAYLRPINTVFQRYALFPHLNVFDNVAFGLRNFSRIMSDLKNSVQRKYENEREELQQKLDSKKLDKSEKIEVKSRLKEIKNTIKLEIKEEKAKLIQKKIEEVENKYTPLIKSIDEKIDIEWEKDDEVKQAKMRIKEIEALILEDISNGTEKSVANKKYENELKNLKKIAVWDSLTKLEKERKELLKDKQLEIKSAKSLMMNKKQIKEAVFEALKLVKLEGYEYRKIEH